MKSIYDFELARIDGNGNVLDEARGKTTLLVNVASECGYTPQYEGLEALHQELARQGFGVIGVPCNQFGGQEPGDEQSVVKFCSERYDVTFPLSVKIEVNGPARHPLYAWLTAPEQSFPGDIAWNFEKFLVDPQGRPRRALPARRGAAGQWSVAGYCRHAGRRACLGVYHQVEHDADLRLQAHFANLIRLFGFRPICGHGHGASHRARRWSVH